uniref:Major facilitator superfamily domain-containing protein 6-A-like n=2 Tax=Hirondellea gigas TaxID=1518452 RepID=A0A6A7FZK2_9CRUS
MTEAECIDDDDSRKNIHNNSKLNGGVKTVEPHDNNENTAAENKHGSVNRRNGSQKNRNGSFPDKNGSIDNKMDMSNDKTVEKLNSDSGKSGEKPNGDDASKKESDESSVSGEKKVKGKSLFDEFSINKKLLPIKLATFCFHGGAFAFLPYITLHMKQVGLTNEEIALTYAILPVSSILGPLIGGVIADRLGAFNAVFIGNVIFTGLLHTLLLLVPQAPRQMGVEMRCDGSGGLMEWRPPITCLEGGPGSLELLDEARNLSFLENPNPKFDYSWSDLNVTLKNCRYQCNSPPSVTNLCFRRHNVTTCTERNLDYKVDFVANMGMSKPLYATTPPSGTSGNLTTTCTRIGNPRMENFTIDGESYDSLSCPNACRLVCDVLGLPDNRKQQNYKYSTTFWVYLSLRVPAQFFTASAFCMMDAVTMAVLAKLGGDFGKQRIMTMLSLGIVPLLSSLMVHHGSRTEHGSPDYAIAFYFGDALLLVSVIVTACLELERPTEPSRHLLQEMKQLLSKLEINVFLLVILVLGSNWGFLESFFFVYLTQLDAPTYLLGLTLTFGCMIGIPVMLVADRIVKKVGRANVFILSFLAYSVRMTGYSLITNPWMSFPFEALEIVTYQLMWVAAVTYWPLLAPATLLATMSGLAGTVHYNCGRGIGALLGGYLMDGVGSVTTFRVFGALSFISGIIYCSLHYGYLRRRIKESDSAENESVELQQSDTGTDRKSRY